LSNNLKLQPTNLKEESFLEELKSLNANLQVVVALECYQSGLGDAKLGTFNLHASLLPNYRGAAPMGNYNGETKTGVSTFH
jgi:methionyl-tRNA formyltransferase